MRNSHPLCSKFCLQALVALQAQSCRQKASSGTTCYLGSPSCCSFCWLQGLTRLLQPQDEAVDFGLIHLALQLSGVGLVLQWEQELQAIIEPGAVSLIWLSKCFNEVLFRELAGTGSCCPA